jgi:hypothetical protein
MQESIEFLGVYSTDGRSQLCLSELGQCNQRRAFGQSQQCTVIGVGHTRQFAQNVKRCEAGRIVPVFITRCTVLLLRIRLHKRDERNHKCAPNLDRWEVFLTTTALAVSTASVSCGSG